MLNRNGVIIQNLLYPKHVAAGKFLYFGACSHCLELFHAYSDPVSESLRDEIYHTLNPFEYIINSEQLFLRCVSQCNRLKIPVRILFIESENNENVWNDNQNFTMNFLGYEYTKKNFEPNFTFYLDTKPSLERYQRKLNKYGLFDDIAVLKEAIDEFKNVITDLDFDDFIEDFSIIKVSQIDNVFSY